MFWTTRGTIYPRWDSSFHPDLASSSPVLGPLQIWIEKKKGELKHYRMRMEADGHQITLKIGHRTRHQEKDLQYCPNLDQICIAKMFSISLRGFCLLKWQKIYFFKYFLGFADFVSPKTLSQIQMFYPVCCVCFHVRMIGPVQVCVITCFVSFFIFR